LFVVFADRDNSNEKALYLKSKIYSESSFKVRSIYINVILS